MKVVAVDVGSSAVKAAIFRDGRRVGGVVREPVATRYEGREVDMDADAVWAAFAAAVRLLGPEARSADRLAADVLAPGFTALTRSGEALSAVITHQDRRSWEQAAEIERRVGADRHLALVGCRPFPGGIASSSLLWLRRNRPDAFARAEVFGQLNTFLNLRLTGAAVVDPGNASFLGLYDTFGMTGWHPELCEALDVAPDRLPEVRSGERVAGRLLPGPADALGLRSGTEVLTGVIDTTAAICSTGAVPGRVFNSIGTTDVLAVVTDRPRPHEKVLTRCLGVGRLWVSVNTIAAGGGALAWVHRNLFADLDKAAFFGLVKELAADPSPSPVRFEPYLAGDRLSLEPKTAGFTGLTLATGRREMLKAVLDAWAELNARGLERIAERADPLPDVYVTGGGDEIAGALHARWPGSWRFHYLDEAALLGMARLAAEG
jgi:sugar (pentulose or hexulose) kinase